MLIKLSGDSSWIDPASIEAVGVRDDKTTLYFSKGYTEVQRSIESVAAEINAALLDPTKYQAQAVRDYIVKLEQANIDLQLRQDTLMRKYQMLRDENALQLAQLRAQDIAEQLPVKKRGWSLFSKK